VNFVGFWADFKVTIKRSKVRYLLFDNDFNYWRNS
jgi:hypothetical protein